MEKYTPPRLRLFPDELRWLEANYGLLSDRKLVIAFAEEFTWEPSQRRLREIREWHGFYKINEKRRQPWTQAETQFLLDNYERMGSKAIAAHFGWDNTGRQAEKRVRKKLLNLKLKRSKAAVKQLMQNAGRKAMKQIHQTLPNPANSLSAGYVAGTLSKGNPEIRSVIKHHPELIALQRQLILLNRQIKKVKQ